MVSDWFRNLSVKRKIGMVVGVLSLVLVVSLGITLVELKKAESRAEAMYREDLLPVGNLTQARTSMLRRINLVNRHMRATSAAESARLESDLLATNASFHEAWSKYEKVLVTDIEREMAPKYYAIACEQERLITEEVLAASKKGDIELARRLLREKVDPTDIQLAPLGKPLVTEAEKHAAEALKTGTAAARQGVIIGIVLAIVGIVLGIGLGWALIRGIHEPLQDFGDALKHVADGDLTVKIDVDRKDEFGTLTQGLNNMVERLRSLLRSVQEGVEGMASGSTELSASADEMSTTSVEIARVAENLRSGNERMSAAVTELSASIDEVNQGTQASLTRLDEAVVATNQGEAAGATTQKAMGEIAETAGHISRAVGVIREIANQTNLLSLNAAIEAAKAGVHGKGFSVVAEEVRKLAERSGTSAKEINTLLDAAQNAVTRGESTVSTTVGTLKAIRSALDTFASQMKTIASATVEQASAGADVARQVDSSAQEATTVASAIIQMSASTAEVARTASQLNELADGLQVQIRRFKL